MAPDVPLQADKRDLSHFQMMMYAVGELGLSLAPQLVVGWLLLFYAPPAGSHRPSYVPLVTLGLLTALGRLSESLANPFMGHWSDTVRTRWGRRLPFVAVGAPILVVTFLMMWYPLTPEPSAANAIYLGVLLVIFWFAYAGTAGPYLSLLPEITPHDGERVMVASWMALADVIGLLLGSVLVGAIVDGFPRGAAIGGIHFQDGYKMTAILFALLTFLCFAAVAATVRETPHSGKKEVPYSFFRSGWECLKNPSFRPYVASGSCFRISLDMAVVSIPYLVIVVMKSTELMAGLTQGIIVVGAAAFFPFVTRLTRAYGKKRVYLASAAMFGVLLCLIPTIGYWPVLSPLASGFVLFTLSSIPVSIYLVLYRPLLADVIDHDEQVTGYRREAMYNGMEGLIVKFAAALVGVIVTQLFYHFGNTAQSPLGIRLVGPVAGGVIFMGFLAFLQYPFSK